jgi:peptidyl-prolyl cis-trans isomerase B (cyclophilin B)
VHQVSPNDRERERARRRYEKQQAARQRREAEARRNRQVVAVVLAVLLVVGSLVGISLAMKGSSGSAPAAGASPSAPASPTAAASPSAAASPTAPASSGARVAGCSAPPAAPGARTATLPDKATAAGKTFVATVTTTCGTITMELDGTKAPQTVASFLGLARGGYWNDSPCHRLVTSGIFVLQCGDPTGTGSGGPGYGFGVENAPKDYQFPAGTLAMARTSDPKSNGGQFFIVYKQTELQDPTGYSIFGKVTGGMDIVDRIAAAGAEPADQSGNTAPHQPISILKVAVTEKKA